MPENNSYLKLKDYFKDLVEKSVHVKSFVGYFQRELMQKDGGDELESPYLAIYGYGNTLSGPEQNTISVRKISFAVMYKGVPNDNIELQYQAVDNAEEIVKKFLSRIRMDSYNPEHFLYKAFIKEGTEISPVELSITSFGSEVSLEFKNNQSLKMNPEDWNDNPATC
jgi:hypothetical protein